MLKAIEQAINQCEPASIRIKNKHDNSPVAAVNYVQCVSGSRDTAKLLIKITVELNKNHGEYLKVKRLLLEEYHQVYSMQLPFPKIDRVELRDAQDLKKVVEFLGREYLADNVFLELGYQESELPEEPNQVSLNY